LALLVLEVLASVLLELEPSVLAMLVSVPSASVLSESEPSELVPSALVQLESVLLALVLSGMEPPVLSLLECWRYWSRKRCRLLELEPSVLEMLEWVPTA
jgi:hypothetical protein